MKAIWTVDQNKWRIDLEREEGDPERGPGQSGSPVGLKATYATVELPSPVKEPHPDVEAMAALVIARPWIGKQLTLRRAVSPAFAQRVEKMFGFTVGPIDDGLMPRTPGSVPILSYSSGFDSVAASVLLPEIPHLHHVRVDHPDLPSQPKYQAQTLANLAAEATQHGRDVKMVRADFEHLVDPYPSLPHWFAFAVGPLLMSEELDAGAFVLGGTLETWFMDMGRKWTGNPSLETGINPLAKLVGLPVMRPTVGLTEVGTMMLSMRHELKGLARSCVGGTEDGPCGQCTKCIRKDLIASAVVGRLVGRLAVMTPETAGWKAITAAPRPFYMQAQFEYALARLRETTPLLRGFRDELQPTATETAWMEQAYEPAVDLFVPEPWRELVRTRISEKLEWMTSENISHMQAWDRSRPRE